MAHGRPAPGGRRAGGAAGGGVAGLGAVAEQAVVAVGVDRALDTGVRAPVARSAAARIASAAHGGQVIVSAATRALLPSEVEVIDNDGGGIRTNSGAVMLTGSTVSGNSTTGSNASGGGIFSGSGAVTLTDSTVSGNTSAGDGGGIYNRAGPVAISRRPQLAPRVLHKR